MIIAMFLFDGRVDHQLPLANVKFIYCLQWPGFVLHILA